MELSEIQSNVKRIKAELATGNPFGEKVLLVAATKTQSADAINAAIDAATATPTAGRRRWGRNCTSG